MQPRPGRRTIAAQSPWEAEARRVELRLKDRLHHEFDRRLGDAVLDRGNPQRSRPAVPLRDLNATDRCGTIVSRPQRSRKLRQIFIGVRREPFDALLVHARRAAVGPDLRPGRRQRRRCVDLVHHAVPNPSFDAVLQRRHHAVRPDGSFHPRPVAGFCALFSPRHCRRFPCLVHSFRIHLPARPSLGVVLLPTLFGFGTMRALTPLRLTLPQRSLRLLRFAFRASRSQPLDGRAHRFLRHHSLSASQGFATQSQARRSIPPKRIRYPTGYAFASCCSPPRLLPRWTQSPAARVDDAVTLGFARYGSAPRGLAPR